MPYVTASGLQIPSVEEILVRIATSQRTNIDALLDTSPESPQGEFNGIFASHLREAWEVLQIAWDSRDPDNSEDDRLDVLAALTGTLREPATPTRFVGSRKLVINLDAATTINAGEQFGIAGDTSGVVFETTETVTSTTAGDYLVSAEASETGPRPANAGTVTVRVTASPGLNSVTNPFDGILGTDGDSDAELRNRRIRELRATGAGTLDSIRADLLSLEVDGENPLLEVTMFENTSDSTNILGLPPHSFEALIFDGIGGSTDNDLIAQTIWNSKPAGIATYGTSSGTAVDSIGQSHTVRFSRPTILDITIDLTGYIDPLLWIGPTLAEQNIVTAAQTIQKPGRDVRWSIYVKQALAQAGLTAVESIVLSSPSVTEPENTDLPMAPRQYANIVTVNFNVSPEPAP